VRFIKSIADLNRDKTVLIVVHAGIIRGLICHFMGLDYGSNLKRKITHRYIGDFTFDGPICIRYDELGTYSGFVKSKIIEIPFYRTELQSA
jgi:broad specificity phosphatase PhoE